MREPNTRVPCRALHDRSTRLQAVLLGHLHTSQAKHHNAYSQTSLLSIPDHTQSSTILHASSRVLQLALGNDIAARQLRELLKTDLCETSLGSVRRTEHVQEARCLETYQRCVPNAADEPVDGA